MRFADEIEREIREMKIPTSPELDQRILADALEAMDGSHNTAAEASSPLSWSAIMASRWTKYAVAAVLVVAVGIGVQLLGAYAGGGNVALADVMVALKKVPWLHVTNEVTLTEGSATTEEWYGFEQGVRGCKDADGSISWTDAEAGTKLAYVPGAESMHVTAVPTEEAELLSGGPLELIERLVALEQQRGASLTKEVGEYEGAKVLVWTVEREEESGLEKIVLYVDPVERLPVGVEVTHAGVTVSYRGKVKFEYTDSGPGNIHELGVPESVAVVRDVEGKETLLEAMVSAIGEKPWMHIRISGAISQEEWFCRDSQVVATRGDDGGIVWIDFSTGEAWEYVPETNTLRRTDMPQTSFDVRNTTFVGVLFSSAKKATKDGASFSFRYSETGDGVVNLLKWEKDGESSMRIAVDVGIGLPIEGRISKRGEGESKEINAVFDYPESGPEDLYDLGMPEDAKIVE